MECNLIKLSFKGFFWFLRHFCLNIVNVLNTDFKLASKKSGKSRTQGRVAQIKISYLPILTTYSLRCDICQRQHFFLGRECCPKQYDPRREFWARHSDLRRPAGCFLSTSQLPAFYTSNQNPNNLFSHQSPWSSLNYLFLTKYIL